MRLCLKTKFKDMVSVLNLTGLVKSQLTATVDSKKLVSPTEIPHGEKGKPKASASCREMLPPS